MNAARNGAPPGPAAVPWAGGGTVLPEIADIAGLPKHRCDSDESPSAARGATTRVRYVENKRIDWERVRQITALSERTGHWANFGPVSLALERCLEFVLRLPSDRAIVMCASATAGLQMLAGIESARLGRALRWVVSAYTFFSQRIGPFADAIVVDCDDRGLIDLDAVTALADDAWDGLVVTNLFAGLASVQPFADLCRARGKTIIVDSAAAMFGPDRGWPEHPNEAISFHQTKPWGAGEGGCIVVNRADAALARSLINLGVGAPPLAKAFAANAKISDIACAVILERLERLPSWAPAYGAQRARIEALCGEVGVPLLLQAPHNAILSSVPALSAQPIGRDLPGIEFDLGKYYPPLDDRCQTAREIYARIVNIPSHCGMATVRALALSRVLEQLLPCGSTHEAKRC